MVPPPAADPSIPARRTDSITAIASGKKMPLRTEFMPVPHALGRRLPLRGPVLRGAVAQDVARGADRTAGLPAGARYTSVGMGADCAGRTFCTVRPALLNLSGTIASERSAGLDGVAAFPVHRVRATVGQPMT